MAEPAKSLLDSLIGFELASVVFVRDYVQLEFDGPQLTCWVWPTIEIEGQPGQTQFGATEYRNELCSFIDQSVVAASENFVDGLLVSFERGQLRISPAEDEQVVEIAMFRTDNDEWDVWQPGVGVFAAQDAPAN